MLNVYFLETEYRYMGWNQVFLELVFYLNEKYGANLIHQRGGHLKIEKYDHDLPDCEILIEDTDKDVLKAISWSESRTKMWDIFVQRNNHRDILLQTQFDHWFPAGRFPNGLTRGDIKFQLKGTPFYTFVPFIDHDYYYYQRKMIKYENMIDKLFFLFSTYRQDGINLRELGICSESPGNLPITDYLQLGIQHKIGLSVASVAEIAYREIEYMAVGIPNMHIEYVTQLNPPLIPNYHYIAVDGSNFPKDHHFHRNGGPEYTEAYRKRFYEVKDDYDFLDFISKNARDYYVNYCSPQNRLNHLIKQLDL